MINLKAMQGLFNPYELHFMELQDLLDGIGISLKDWLKIDVQDECSKSIDGSCINCECEYNLVKLHDEDLYCEVLKEIQAERREVEERTKRQMQKYYGDS